jgi:hypothetical protein
MIDTHKSTQKKKAKQKRLPKAFDKLLQKGDLDALKAGAGHP